MVFMVFMVFIGFVAIVLGTCVSETVCGANAKKQPAAGDCVRAKPPRSLPPWRGFFVVASKQRHLLIVGVEL